MLKENRTNHKKIKNKLRTQLYKKKNRETIIIFTKQQYRIKMGHLYFPKKVNLKIMKTRIKNKLDNEEFRHHNKFLGIRISRSLFRTFIGTLINADVNACYNILNNVFPNSIKVDEIKASILIPPLIYQNVFDTIN
ncbi:MAG: hypothetical protein ACFFG0_35570 [Candidatus Thorarchaeota archaeon]